MLSEEMKWSVPVAGGEIPVIGDDERKDKVVILAHGAGSHMEHKTIEWLAGLVREAGACVVRFNFLYRALGKSMPDRMPICVATYRAVIDSVRERMSPQRLIIGGHSFGGRVASMLESEGQTSDGLMLFGYPLHPPGQPEKLRDEHLLKIQTPTLQINGTEDELCTKEIMDRIYTTLDGSVWDLEWIVGANHTYGIRKGSGNTRHEMEKQISETLCRYLERV